MAASAASHLEVVARIVAAVFAGYAFTWGFVALAVGLLFGAGMPFHDAEILSYLFAFIVFLVAFLWAFAAASVVRVWIVLAGGGALMVGAASLVQRALL